MKFKELLKEKNCDINGKKAPCIAFLGDSVTQGCFEVYRTGEASVETVYESENAYHSKLKSMLSEIYPKVPVNIINAGISGGNAQGGFERIERDVLCYKPDLVVVCFGLNDCAAGIEGIEKYISSLETIFREIRLTGAEIIFMTPNMMNTKVSCHINDSFIKKLAEEFAEIQNGGILDLYIEKAVSLCERENVPVCDCYKKWKMMEHSGADTTELLSNYLNHPTRQMHWLFAYSLFDMIMFG